MKIWVVILLVVLVIILIYILDYLITINKLKKETINNIVIKNNTVDLNSLTLRQKIAQMIIIKGDREKNVYLTNLDIGGIYIYKQKTKQDYTSLINKYQNASKIKLFVATDMEGAWNPFSNFKSFPKFSEIGTEEEAYNVGLEEGKFMKDLGFNLNFAPVAEYEDKAYGESFSWKQGRNKREIKRIYSRITRKYSRNLQTLSWKRND